MATQVEILVALLKENKEKLELAGMLGNQLLDSNNSLQEEVRTAGVDYNALKDKFSQDEFRARTKFDELSKSISCLEADNDLLQERYVEVTIEKAEVIKHQADTIVKPLKQELARVRTDYEQQVLLVKDSTEHLQRLKNIIQELRQQNVNVTLDTTDSSAVAYQNDINNLENDKICLCEQLCTLKADLLEAQHLTTNTEHKYQVCNEDLLLCTDTSNTNKKMLDEARDELIVLHSELSSLRSGNSTSKGNSLFSEVEDRRIVVEKDLIEMKTSIVDLSKLNKQYLIKIKKQKDEINKLFKMANHRNTDCSQTSRLLQELHQLTAEVKRLQDSKLSKETVPVPDYDLHLPAKDEFYAWKLEEEKKLTSKLEKELGLMEGQLHCLHSKIVDVETLFNESNMRLNESTSREFKLKQAHEELRLKYETDNYNNRGVYVDDDDDNSKKRSNGDLDSTTSNEQPTAQTRKRSVKFAIDEEQGSGGGGGDDVDDHFSPKKPMKKSKASKLYDLKSVTKISKSPMIDIDPKVEGSEDCSIQ